MLAKRELEEEIKKYENELEDIKKKKADRENHLKKL